MTCVNNSCGTGGFTGPKPGDPDNNVSLSANTVYGGIKVAWTYPTTNPHAVAYTILYRGLTNDFSLAVKQHEVAGSVYFDALNPTVNTDYYYWIQIVSVNDTVADHVGPAVGTAVPIGVQTLASLSGLIDSSVLAMSLKGQIDSITTVDGRISQEILDRLTSASTISAALNTLQSNLDGSMTLVQQEITQRKDANTALASSYSILGASVNGNTAAIISEQTARANGDSANAHDISILYSNVGSNSSAISNEITARVNGDSALASQITTAQSTLNGNIAAVQTTLQTNINTNSGKITAIGALYSAKLTVNGLVGGFGIYNDGSSVDAGFDVDTFWVGKTGANKVKPFIISGGIVYIDSARIGSAAIDTLKVAGNAITGISAATGGSNTIPASGSVDLISVGLTMPAGASGVVITITASLNSANNSSQLLGVVKDGTMLATSGKSLQGGFADSAVFTCVDPSPTVGYSTYTFRMWNPSSGPGSVQSANITSSSIVVSGAKR